MRMPIKESVPSQTHPFSAHAHSNQRYPLNCMPPRPPPLIFWCVFAFVHLYCFVYTGEKKKKTNAMPEGHGVGIHPLH